MSTKQTTITLVLNDKQTEKRIELADRPKKFKHLKFISKKLFGLNITNSAYIMHFKDQKIPLLEDNMDLTQFFKQPESIEIHILSPGDQISSGNDDWELIGGSGFLASDNHDVHLNYDGQEEDFLKKSSLSLLNDMSMISNSEKTIIYDDLLKEKFTDFELDQVLHNAKNETKLEMIRQQKMQEREWENEKRTLESFYEKKIINSEKSISELTFELDKFKTSLTDTRSQLFNMTQQSQTLESEISKLSSAEAKSKEMEERRVLIFLNDNI